LDHVDLPFHAPSRIWGGRFEQPGGACSAVLRRSAGAREHLGVRDATVINCGV
jgi:hypothetical protein